MRIYLQPITKDDGHLIVKWRNSPNVMSHCLNKDKVTLESNAEFYDRYVATGHYKQFIVNRVDDQFEMVSYPIATVYLKDMDYHNNRCELCVFTSDDQEWDSESQSIAIRMLIEKAFQEYGMHKVYSYVFAKNKDEVKLLERSGMVQEALLIKEAMDMDGTYADIIRMCTINVQ